MSIEDMSDEEFSQWMDENWHFTWGDLVFILSVIAVTWIAVELG